MGEVQGRIQTGSRYDGAPVAAGVWRGTLVARLCLKLKRLKRRSKATQMCFFFFLHFQCVKTILFQLNNWSKTMSFWIKWKKKFTAYFLPSFPLNPLSRTSSSLQEQTNFPSSAPVPPEKNWFRHWIGGQEIESPRDEFDARPFIFFVDRPHSWSQRITHNPSPTLIVPPMWYQYLGPENNLVSHKTLWLICDMMFQDFRWRINWT